MFGKKKQAEEMVLREDGLTDYDVYDKVRENVHHCGGSDRFVCRWICVLPQSDPVGIISIVCSESAEDQDQADH